MNQDIHKATNWHLGRNNGFFRKTVLTLLSCTAYASIAWAATGTGSTSLGTNAAANETETGNNNTSIGENAALTNTTGVSNTMAGYNSGYNNTAANNTFLGAQAGESNTTGADNTFIGARAGQANTTASDNVFIGTETGLFNTTGQDNTFVGEEAGYRNTTGQRNTFVGEDAGRNNSTGEQNTFVGNRANGTFSGTDVLTGHNNVALGDEAGFDLSATASRNTAVGAGAGDDLGEGFGNTFVGSESGSNTEFSDWVTFVGAFAGWDNNRTNYEDDSNRNTAIGAFAGFANRTGEDNVWMGAFSGSFSSPYSYDADLENEAYTLTNHTTSFSSSTPSGNTDVYRTTVVGAFAGANDDDSVALGYAATTSKTNSLALGSYADATGQSAMAIGFQASSTHTEAIAIGYQAVSHGNYTVTLGNNNTAVWHAGADATASLGMSEDCTYSTYYETWTCNTPYRFADVVTQEISMIATDGSSAKITFWADDGDDYDDRWDLEVEDSGALSLGTYVSSTFSTGKGETLRRTELFSLENTGELTLSGSLNLNSDRRLKTDIHPISNALALIEQIQGVTYFWKPELNRSGLKQIGVIAQDIEAVLPELVSTDQRGVKSVNYQGLIPVLINAHQELQLSVFEQNELQAQLQQEINMQDEMLAQQQREIDALLKLANNL